MVIEKIQRRNVTCKASQENDIRAELMLDNCEQPVVLVSMDLDIAKELIRQLFNADILETPRITQAIEALLKLGLKIPGVRL